MRMNNRRLGIKNFRKRIAIAIRDDIFRVFDDPSSEAINRNIPLMELAPVAELSPEQRTEWKKFIAGIIDRGILHFLYGLDSTADGFEIRYYGEVLNNDGDYLLSDISTSISDESQFDSEGCRKPT